MKVCKKQQTFKANEYKSQMKMRSV